MLWGQATLAAPGGRHVLQMGWTPAVASPLQLRPRSGCILNAENSSIAANAVVIFDGLPGWCVTAASFRDLFSAVVRCSFAFQFRGCLGLFLSFSFCFLSQKTIDPLGTWRDATQLAWVGGVASHGFCLLGHPSQQCLQQGATLQQSSDLGVSAGSTQCCDCLTANNH